MDSLADSQALAGRLGLTYPLASDPELRVIRSYGVEMSGKAIALPATFVLQKGSGRIVYRHIGETIFDRPAVKAILDAVTAGMPADPPPGTPPPEAPAAR